MNNVDIAISKVRELQSLIYDPNSSQNSLFKKTQEIINVMQLASQEIKMNYEDISRKLTDHLNTGKPQ
jgi:translation initiation factor 2 alpha subunit (eIF-2alpha)